MGSLLVEEADIGKFAALMKEQWEVELARNGLAPVRAKPPSDAANAGDGVTCPACGTTAPLVAGACSDCGLVLG